MSILSLGLGFGIGLELISVPDLVPVHICHFVHTGLCLKLMPHWWFTYKMLGAEFECQLVFLCPVSDLVLFLIKSGSRSRIRFCLEPNLSLGIGFGFVKNQI